MINDTKIAHFVLENKEELFEHRRWFHQHPETSFKEFKTSEYIQNYLRNIGIENIKTICKTGVICEIGNTGLIHGARFNMDGLPIAEENNLPFCSVFSGYSHSCGHDFELAWGILIAKYFQENKPAATIRLIFQPAEEGPGEEEHGKTGGQLLAELGAFDIQSIMSLHVEPELPLGTLSIIEGEVTCTAYDFNFVLKGKTCHAAKVHQGINPIPIATQLIENIYHLQNAINNEIKDDEGFLIITVSSIASRHQLDNLKHEESINTVPEYVIIKGICRLRSNKVKNSLINGLKQLEIKYKVNLQDCILKINKVAVATINHKICVENALETAKNNNIKVVSKRTTWRDDAGWASEKAPSAHGFIGIHDGIITHLHSPTFNPNENALLIGLTIFLGTLERNMIAFNKINKFNI
ncbi:MAG: M20 family metallopeptidase [Alphaproteobacteria bacterium]|nr:M20 family metallopeptidase [Alphaproteobacteria bacterium]